MRPRGDIKIKSVGMILALQVVYMSETVAM